MQTNLSRRFLLIAVALVMTTVGPWLVWTRLVRPAPGKTLPRYELGLGLDLKGGASITYRVRAPEGFEQSSVLADAIKITRRRIDSYGLSEVNITESGIDQFTVELPGRGKEEIDRIKSVMGGTGALEFRIVADTEKTTAERGRRQREAEKYVVTEGYRWVPGGGGDDRAAEYLIETPEDRTARALAAAQRALEAARSGEPAGADIAALERRVKEAEDAHETERARWVFRGEDIARAAAERNQQGLGYVVAFEMKAGRSSAFGDFTGDHIQRQMAIVLNGVVETAPEIKSKLPGSGQISSDLNPYTQESASDLVTVLQSGALAAKPEEISSFVVGPGLGEDAVRRGRIAVLVSFLLVIGCMAWYYRGVGWVANLALLLNLIMTLGALMFLGAALSLPGIAGLLLTLGMAVDANILVNERIREEKATGKGLLQAISAGYDRAFITILDSNLTTVITAAILYAIGTGPVQGFALTLILGLAISMFTALYVTRTLFLWGIEKGILTEFRMGPVMFQRNWDFLGMRRPLIRVSTALLALGAVAFAFRAVEDKYDLEFTGGQRVVVSLRRPIEISAMRAHAAAVGTEMGLGDVAVRTIRGRGVDADRLDLSQQSDAFELTARSRDEAGGRMFTAAVEEKLAEVLAPRAVEIRECTVPATGGAAKVVVRLNFSTRDATAEGVRTVLAAHGVFSGDRDLKVEPVPDPTEGSISFLVTGNADVRGVDDTQRRLALTEALLASVEAKEGLDLSDPVPQSDFIGPGVARRLRDEAMLAVVLSILAQILYLRFRFRDFTYGFAAAIALVHDVVITLGAVAVCDAAGIAHVKINLPVIAAFLTLIGFSMNDTIVVFDRIRENLGRSVIPDTRLLNASLNQTLARSIRTSMTVLVVAVTLFAVNYGAASSLEGFAFVMMVGVVAGTYSSVAIACPLLLFLPLYGARLAALGRAVVWGMIAALVAGSVLALAGDGVVAWIGLGLSSLLPLHFLGSLLRWLNIDDADAQLLAAVGKRGVSRSPAQEAG